METELRYLDHVWYCGALSQEVGAKPIGRTICDLPIVLFRTEQGRVAALEDRCSHRQAPLSLGSVIGEEIQCSYHGFTFDCVGACVHVPHQEAIPKATRIRAYQAVERWGYIWLWFGPPEQATPETVPALPWTEDPNLRTVFFHFQVKANVQLMADNLLDVSHTDFLHRHSIGSQTGQKGQSDTPKVELQCRTEGERVHFVRRVHDTTLGPVAMKWAGTAKPVDRTNVLMWEAPNTIHSILEFKNAERCSTIHMEHIMVPETAETMHYFMNWTRDFGLDNIGYPTDQDVWTEQMAVVTGDDVPMVEAQQANLARFPAARDVAARQDQFIAAVHRALGQLYDSADKTLPPELQRLIGSPTKAAVS